MGEFTDMYPPEKRGSIMNAAATFVFGMAALVSMVMVVLGLRNSVGNELLRPAALQAIDNMSYVRDHASNTCFAVTWIVTGSEKKYLMTWIPCGDSLPVANTPVMTMEMGGMTI